jgi:hypothetical protein
MKKSLDMPLVLGIMNTLLAVNLVLASLDHDHVAVAISISALTLSWAIWCSRTTVIINLKEEE